MVTIPLPFWQEDLLVILSVERACTYELLGVEDLGSVKTPRLWEPAQWPRATSTHPKSEGYIVKGTGFRVKGTGFSPYAKST
jgi:hypothetical protein